MQSSLGVVKKDFYHGSIGKEVTCSNMSSTTSIINPKDFRV